MVPFQNFQTADGWIVVACPKRIAGRRLCDGDRREDLPSDPRFGSFAARDLNREALVAELDAHVLRARPRPSGSSAWPRQACRPLRSTPCARRWPIRRSGARSALAELEHPVLGTRPPGREPAARRRDRARRGARPIPGRAHRLGAGRALRLLARRDRAAEGSGRARTGRRRDHMTPGSERAVSSSPSTVMITALATGSTWTTRPDRPAGA